jgi:hypothetical protein
VLSPRARDAAYGCCSGRRKRVRDAQAACGGRWVAQRSNRLVGGHVILLAFTPLLVSVAWILQPRRVSTEPRPWPHGHLRAVSAGLLTGALTGFSGSAAASSSCPHSSSCSACRSPSEPRSPSSRSRAPRRSPPTSPAPGSTGGSLPPSPGAAIGEALLGRRLGGRPDQRRLSSLFALLLVAAAVVLVIENARTLVQALKTG